jgi:RHS repeat-associated protein
LSSPLLLPYLPFGETRNAKSEIDNYSTDKLFTGQRLDGTGLYYYNARYYDPTIGRFISPDTVIQSPGNPQTLNRYSYSLNNPLKYIDPSGHVVEINGYNVQAIDYLKSLPGSMPTEIKSLVTNVVSSPMYQAYDAIRSVDTTVTNALQSSKTTFAFSQADLGVGMVLQYPDGSQVAAGWVAAETGFRSGSENTIVDIKFNNNSLVRLENRNLSNTIKNMAHEMVHCYANILDPLDLIPDTKFEENIGNKYSSFICGKLGFDNTTKIGDTFNGWSLDQAFKGSGYQGYPTLPQGGNSTSFKLGLSIITNPIQNEYGKGYGRGVWW